MATRREADVGSRTRGPERRALRRAVVVHPGRGEEEGELQDEEILRKVARRK